MKDGIKEMHTNFDVTSHYAKIERIIKSCVKTIKWCLDIEFWLRHFVSDKYQHWINSKYEK